MKNLVSVVITTHGQGRGLPVILGSLEDQRAYVKGIHSKSGHGVLWVAGEYLDPRDYPFEVIITCDGEFEGYGEYSCFFWNGLVIENEKQGSPGHHTRGPGIEVATGSWIVLTNADNYFMSGWRNAIELYLANEGVGAVYYDGISNLWKYDNRKPNGVELKRGFIDLSFFVVRSEIAKFVGFPFRDYEGDWDYIFACIKQCKNLGLEIKKVAGVLAVHN